MANPKRTSSDHKDASVIDDQAAFNAAVEEGQAAIRAGDFVPLEQVDRWLASWGKEDELPPPT